jgi:antitoxin FitA
MPTITLKNVSKETHAALKQRAKLHKRSLNQEAILCLDTLVGRERRDAAQILARLRKLRSEITVKEVDLKWIDDAKRHGRA